MNEKIILYVVCLERQIIKQLFSMIALQARQEAEIIKIKYNTELLINSVCEAPVAYQLLSAVMNECFLLFS